MIRYLTVNFGDDVKHMIKLDEQQLNTFEQQLQAYMAAPNAAEGQKLNANANVTKKTVGTTETSLMDGFLIQLNRHRVCKKLEELFPAMGLGDEYLRQLNTHEIYCHDESSIKPYCASISMYPMLTDGNLSLGGVSAAPKHFDAFCGGFVSMLYNVASNFAGAVATVEFLMYFDYFATKDFGPNYLQDNEREIIQGLQSVIYPVNEPCAARGNQSVFWNISLFDKEYFTEMFGDFCFPDGTGSDWDQLSELQNYFMKWFNAERERRILTFPVVTVAALTQDGKIKDEQFARDRAQDLAEGNSFFTYLSDNPDSLASCCRLRNELGNNDFSFSLGAGGVQTGSLNVITVNMNRLVQDGRDLAVEIGKIHKYQYAHKSLIQELLDAELLPAYDAGYITASKQFLTIGINGWVEAAEYLGIEPVAENEAYKEWTQAQLKVIFDLNKEQSLLGQKFNTEFVPAENLGVKNAKWDSADGYDVPRECYNSYFYRVEDECDYLEKMELHGADMVAFLDGGSALHLNLNELPTAENAYKLLNMAAANGVNYFCTNVRMTLCRACDHVDKQTRTVCESCGSDDVGYATRVIGYLKPVDTWSSARQKEAGLRFYH
jgi:ribonucleoside-triphosphate reductase